MTAVTEKTQATIRVTMKGEPLGEIALPGPRRHRMSRHEADDGQHGEEEREDRQEGVEGEGGGEVVPADVAVAALHRRHRLEEGQLLGHPVEERRRLLERRPLRGPGRVVGAAGPSVVIGARVDDG